MHIEWTELAVCRGEDINVFFPVEPGSTAYRVARTFCARCPVQAACLEFALRFTDDQDRDGMFGGMTPGERSKVRYQRLWTR